MYAWEENRERCYQLYVTEAKSMDEVMELMRLRYNFTPRQVQPCFLSPFTCAPLPCPPPRPRRLYSPIGVVPPASVRPPARRVLRSLRPPYRLGSNQGQPTLPTTVRRPAETSGVETPDGNRLRFGASAARIPETAPLPICRCGSVVCWVGAIRLSRRCNALSPNSIVYFSPIAIPPFFPSPTVIVYSAISPSSFVFLLSSSPPPFLLLLFLPFLFCSFLLFSSCTSSSPPALHC